MSGTTRLPGARPCRLALSFCVALIGLAGCVTTPPPSDTFPAVTEPEVRLQPGDVVRVQFTYWPELNDEQMVRPDGKISLQLVGDVQAGGKAPESLRDELLVLYADRLREPEINVVVASWNSHRVYVGGEVLSPGVLQMTGRMTVLEAIMQAGGFNKTTAKLTNVVIVRQHEGQQYAQTFDLRAALENPESEAVHLAPFDVVYVPRTNIDQVGDWVDQYINRLVPESVLFNFFYDLGRTSTRSDATTFQFQATPF